MKFNNFFYFYLNFYIYVSYRDFTRLRARPFILQFSSGDNISEVKTPLGSVRRKPTKTGTRPPFEPSVKNIDEESNPDAADATNRGTTIW
jgi:hypothetical protein